VTAFNPNPQIGPPTINAIAVFNGLIYVGGWFQTIGGPARTAIAALEPTGAATSWNPTSDGGVNALAFGGGVVYVAGGFTHIGGAARNQIAALDLGTGNALPWSADFVGGPALKAVGLSGNSVIVGGTFLTLAGSPQRNLACLSAVGTVGVEGPATTLRVGELRSVAPNPSRGSVRIEYALASRSPVRLEVVDVRGRVHAKLDEGIREAGPHSVEWSPDRSRRLPSGVYFVVLEAGAHRSVMRLVELR